MPEHHPEALSDPFVGGFVRVGREGLRLPKRVTKLPPPIRGHLVAGL
jgi:hypothetical protein